MAGEQTPTGDSTKLPDEYTRDAAIKRFKRLEEMGFKKHNQGGPPSSVGAPPRS